MRSQTAYIMPTLKAVSKDGGGAIMYAIIKTGGKQYKVSEGDTLFVEKLEVEEGSSVTFDKVLMAGEGDDVKVGAPTLDGATVEAIHHIELPIIGVQWHPERFYTEESAIIFDYFFKMIK